MQFLPRYVTTWALLLVWLFLVVRFSRGLLSFIYPASDIDYTFIGYYRAGFETSSFVTCESFGVPGAPHGYDSFGTPGYGRGYWLEAMTESGFWSRFADLTPHFRQHSSASTMEDSPSVFVRFIGHVSPPRALFAQYGYGHMGLYSREITVTQLVEMRLDTRPRGYLILQVLVIYAVPLILAVLAVHFATHHWAPAMQPTHFAVRTRISLFVLLTSTFLISSLGLQFVISLWTCQ
jgi:hypothetical protein